MMWAWGKLLLTLQRLLVCCSQGTLAMPAQVSTLFRLAPGVTQPRGCVRTASSDTTAVVPTCLEVSCVIAAMLFGC